MSSLYVTGDTHGEYSLNRLSTNKFPIGKTLTRDDYVLVLGDFGLIFEPVQSKAEKWWEKWLNERPFTILFVCGNHENHHRLRELPTEEKFGGIVGKVSDNIFYLKRGEIYEIAGKKILAFGGAASIDKEHRLINVSWWAEEVPSYREMENCLSNLEKHDNKVDIIAAHTCPDTLANIVVTKKNITHKSNDPTGRMLEHIVTSCEFQGFYCGHWHIDFDFGKYHFVYEKVYQIV